MGQRSMILTSTVTELTNARRSAAPAFRSPGKEEVEDKMESEHGHDGMAQLAVLPEGLRTLAGELRSLKVQSTRLDIPGLHPGSTLLTIGV